MTASARESGLSVEAEGLLLDMLAVVGQSSVGQLSQIPSLSVDGSPGLLVTVLGVLTPADAEAMDDARALGGNWVVVWPEADRRILPLLFELGYPLAEDGGVLLYGR